MDDVTKTSENNGGAQYGRFGSGKPVRRVEDADLLVGRGRFADDVSAPNQVFACFLRSPHPHARIVAIDKAAANRYVTRAMRLPPDDTNIDRLIATYSR